MDIKITEATTQDIAIIQDIANITWHHSYADMISRAQIEYMLAAFYNTQALIEQIDMQLHRFLIAYVRDVSVGFAAYEVDAIVQSTTKLHKLYILPEYQGKGIAKQLIDRIINNAQHLGQQSLILNVNRNNKAIAFYKQQGFTIIDEVDIDIGGGYYMNDYIMSRAIG